MVFGSSSLHRSGIHHQSSISHQSSIIHHRSSVIYICRQTPDQPPKRPLCYPPLRLLLVTTSVQLRSDGMRGRCRPHMVSHPFASKGCDTAWGRHLPRMPSEWSWTEVVSRRSLSGGKRLLIREGQSMTGST